jgi:hypothetical protein
MLILKCRTKFVATSIFRPDAEVALIMTEGYFPSGPAAEKIRVLCAAVARQPVRKERVATPPGTARIFLDVYGAVPVSRPSAGEMP